MKSAKLWMNNILVTVYQNAVQTGRREWGEAVIVHHDEDDNQNYKSNTIIIHRRHILFHHPQNCPTSPKQASRISYICICLIFVRELTSAMVSGDHTEVQGILGTPSKTTFFRGVPFQFPFFPSRVLKDVTVHQVSCFSTQVWTGGYENGNRTGFTLPDSGFVSSPNKGPPGYNGLFTLRTTGDLPPVSH